MNESRRTGGKPATINDIARLAEVSKKTVSRVINNSPFVKEETRKRVEAVIAEHGFTPDPQARGLAFRRSFLVGMIYDTSCSAWSCRRRCPRTTASWLS